MTKRKRSRILAAVLALGLTLSPALPYGSGSAVYAAGAKNVSPPLLITELMPDTENVNGADGYEFIEIYNNTDKPLPFHDYKILYRYLESSTLWPSVPDDVVIEPGGTLVFWIMNGKNGEKTVADFNTHFGTQLVENKDIVQIYSGGMANTRMREVVVTTNTGRELVSAFYNEGEQISAPDKAILYQYPETGGKQMKLMGWGTKPGTPGSVSPDQVPAVPVQVTDTLPPAIEDRTDKEAAASGENLSIVAEVTDNVQVTSLTLFYKTDKQNDYRKANVRLDPEDGLYRYSIGLLDLLGGSYIDYYFTASDGRQETTSGTSRIAYGDSQTSPRLNVQSGKVLGGSTVLRGTVNGTSPDQLKLTIDDTLVTGTYPSLEKPAYFVFEANGIGQGNQNALTIGSELVGLVDKTASNFETVIVPVDPSLLREGKNDIAFRAGSSTGTYYEDKPITGLDDYDVRNVRLVLPDGTELRDPAYADPAALIDMGDDGRFLPVVTFSFPVAGEELTSIAYPWDTAGVTDGAHVVKATAPDGQSASARVIVDNNGPSIATTLEEGKQYKGPFTIDADITDAGAGIASSQVMLDRQRIQLPYEASSAKLAAGSHELFITSEDKIGNKSELTVRFTVPAEAPDQPVLVTPEHGAETGLNPELRVSVSDPTNDDLSVSFFKGYKYDAASGGVQLFKNATEWEPPLSSSPAGESALTEEEKAAVSASDDQYVTVDSETEFPYLRFQIKLDGQIGAQDIVEVDWVGKTLPGRKVTMYAWNHTKAKWMPVTSHVPSSEADFTLKGKVSGQDYVRENIVNVLIQDLIPGRGDYDFTMVWMSDTQFYSELYPQIYESQVNWIKDNAGAMNIRYVAHTGDIVNEPTSVFQWERASKNMQVLEDANVPYGVLAGNHDVGTTDSDYTTYYRYFGEDRFDKQPYYGGAYKNNRGHYDLISAGGNDFIIVYMGWQPEDEDIAWMNQVLREHPDRQAFLGFHDYMQPNGTRSSMGERIYEQVVVPNPNVKMVMSGHYTGSSMQTDALDDNGDGTPDRTVYQILNDYQGHEEGGLGYMKLLHFDTESGSVYLNTYSPYKNDYNYYEPEQYPGKDETTLSFDLTPQMKRVATNYLTAKLYTDEKIGSPVQAASGQTASVEWSGLQANQPYGWYVRVEDSFGGLTYGDVWSFRTRNLPGVPANLRASAVTESSVSLVWDQNGEPGSVTYDVYQNGTSIASVSSAPYQVSGLSADTSYQFYLRARDGNGVLSEPSETITVRTAINLGVLTDQTNRYIQSGELGGPLAKQLTNSLEQVRHHLDKGNTKQAAGHLENFQKHLNNKALQKHIQAAAKELLNQQSDALLKAWRTQ
ncbi:metallophosphoesterase [Paenibacillus sp. FJAT-26967]|uniref:FIMAH domain-containing protein n=1 Tax=Paenibacillus sp. FJAT-26967 TaxID=1729690 RepID=UPI0008388DB9|nr:metallophosphoesterase [Paenibacillus sp. FJAT-26967]